MADVASMASVAASNRLPRAQMRREKEYAIRRGDEAVSGLPSSGEGVQFPFHLRPQKRSPAVVGNSSKRHSVQGVLGSTTSGARTSAASSWISGSAGYAAQLPHAASAASAAPGSSLSRPRSLRAGPGRRAGTSRTWSFRPGMATGHTRSHRVSTRRQRSPSSGLPTPDLRSDHPVSVLSPWSPGS